MDDKIKNMYKKEEKVIFEEYQNAYILPRLIKNDGSGWGLGGVLESSKKFVELSAYHGGWIDQGGYYDFDDFEENNEHVIYMGLFFKHWGHFLVDLLPRLWFVSSYPETAKKCKIAYIGEEKPDGNYLLLLNLLGIKEEQLIHITKPTLFNKVIVPAYSCRPCIWFTDEYVKMFDTIVKNALKDYIVPNNFKNIDKVYFSRTAFSKAKKTEFGEKMIEQVYKENGYNILYPEKLTLFDQIYIWNKAEHIACLNGSIPLNLVFCMNKNLKIDILNKTSAVHLNLYLYLLMREVTYNHIQVYLEPYKFFTSSLGSGPFLLSITSEFRDYLNANNLNNHYSIYTIYINNIVHFIKYTYYIVNPIHHMKMLIYPLYKRIKKR